MIVDSFRRLLQLHPEYRPLFGFEETVEEIQNTQRLKAHGINVVYMLNMLFDNFDDMDMIDELIFKLVKLHMMRGIDQIWLDDIIEPFELVLEEFNAKIQIERIEVLRKAFIFIKNRMQELYDENVVAKMLDTSDISEY